MFLVIPGFFPAGLAQESGTGEPREPAPATGTKVVDKSSEAGIASPRKESIDALSSVQESYRLVEAELTELRKNLESSDEVERENLETKIRELVSRQEDLFRDFESIATGIDPEEYEGEIEGEFVFSDEIDSLLRPLIEELKELTEEPREIEELRRQQENWRERLETTRTALRNLDTLSESQPIPESLEKFLSVIRATWDARARQAENRVQALTYQLEQAERSQRSILTAIKDGFRSFYRSRGRNFVLSVLAFFATLFLFRYLHRLLHRRFSWHERKNRPFYLRLLDVGLYLFSLLGATLAAIATLYATGDWVLMGLALIILVGLALAAKNALPRVLNQSRLLLNLGEIREGERVIYNGVPWRVERLSFYTTFRNDHLRGGMVRLPVTHLSDLVSRPIAEGEQWFPCDEGDWIELPDGVRGRVVAQTPEYVQLVELGGAKVTIPTIDFLAASPRNLSCNFRISSTFGIDYQHQADCTTKIPEKMWAHLTREIFALVENRELVLSLKVEFASAGASSLDYAIIADFDGALASKIQVLERALQRFAVDCCNANGWVIPFTQVTIHEASSDPDESPAPKAEEA